MLNFNKVRSVEDLGDGKYAVFIDASGNKGLLHFTHEVTIWITNGEFDNADTLCSGGWIVFSKEDIDDFENTYPGFIDIAKNAIKKLEDN